MGRHLHGDLDRQGSRLEGKGGKSVVLKALPMLRGPYPRKACK